MAQKRKPVPRFHQNLYQCHYNAVSKVVNAHFQDDSKTKLWMESINPLLGNFTPIQMLKLGRFHKLMQFIYMSLDENKNA